MPIVKNEEDGATFRDSDGNSLRFTTHGLRGLWGRSSGRRRRGIELNSLKWKMFITRKPDAIMSK